MNTITLLLGACALAALSAGTAGAGPCTAEIDTVTKLLASKDAGAGPTAGGASATTGQHPPSATMGVAVASDVIRASRMGLPHRVHEGAGPNNRLPSQHEEPASPASVVRTASHGTGWNNGAPLWRRKPRRLITCSMTR